MQLAKVKKNVFYSGRYEFENGYNLLIVDVIDENDKVLEPAIVAADNNYASPGDRVIISRGPNANFGTNKVVDAIVVAVVKQLTDYINF